MIPLLYVVHIRHVIASAIAGSLQSSLLLSVLRDLFGKLPFKSNITWVVSQLKRANNVEEGP
jgi:hypothetical protein